MGKILNKMDSTYKMDWDQKLPLVVHAYNTSEKKTIEKSPYFLVFGQTELHGIEMEVETLRVMATKSRNRIQDSKYQMIAIQDLEEARDEALKQTIDMQAKKKKDFDAKLPKSHGIQAGGMVLLYYNRHEEFLGKLHTRCMGPYRVLTSFKMDLYNLKIFKGTGLTCQ